MKTGFQRKKIAVLGSGHIGHAIAASFSRAGYPVTLVSMTRKIDPPSRNRIQITESGEVHSYLMRYSRDLGNAIKEADVIFCTVPAFYHETTLLKMLPYLQKGQYIYFSSYFAAMRMVFYLSKHPLGKEITVVESMSAVYAARSKELGSVEILAMKDQVPLSSYPTYKVQGFIDLVRPALPCFKPVDNILMTSLNNVGPILHVPLMLFSTARIESETGDKWSLYKEGLTHSVQHYITELDRERLAISEGLGVTSFSLPEIMMKIFYKEKTQGETNFWNWIRNNAIHATLVIGAPNQINTRYLTEGVYFGLKPLIYLAKEIGIKATALEATLTLCDTLLAPYQPIKRNPLNFLQPEQLNQVQCPQITALGRAA